MLLEPTIHILPKANLSSRVEASWGWHRSEQNPAGTQDYLRTTNNDVVDWDEHKLHGVSDEAHNAEPDSASHRNLFELLRVRLRTTLNEATRVDSKLVRALNDVPDWVVLVSEERHILQGLH